MWQYYNCIKSLCAGLLFLAGFSAYTQNLVVNPGFESGALAPWFSDNGNSADLVGEAFAGSYASLGNVAQNVNLTAGVTYELRCKARIIRAADQEKVWIGVRAAAGLVKNARVTATQWEDMFIEFVAAETGPYKLWIWGQGASAYSSDDWTLVVKGTPSGGGKDPSAQWPASHPAATWPLNPTFSDEFNAGPLDVEKWDHDPSDWGTWSWEPGNAYVADSALTLRMLHESHVRNGQDYHFTSGIARHRETFTYGYFEARMKASAKGQGTCPAFWMYSIGQPDPTEEGGVKYCEIDAIEIFQVPNELQRLEMNLHARILQDGKLTWIRPGQGHTELTHNTWVAPWDPRDEYHTYGVWNRVDSIFWYVDGIERGAKKNHYWHLPMHLTVSMGLRTPYEKYINGVRTVMPYPDTVSEPGFPTEMYCDYVRVWDTDPQLYADRERYHEAAYPVGGELLFECRYFAGNNNRVLAEGWSGLTCKLQQISPDGTVVREITQTDSTAIGKEAGLASFRFFLEGLPPTSALPEGHRYVLRPVFRTSHAGGADVYLVDDYYPIELQLASGINEQEAAEQIQIVSRTDGISIQLAGPSGASRVAVYDLAGRQVHAEVSANSEIFIRRERFPQTGVYIVAVTNGSRYRTEKVVIAP